jgi:isoleucyl-tRNA synthetase
MYTFRADSPERRSGQTAMFHMAASLLKVMAPILAMTSDEAWGYMQFDGKADSVHLAEWPDGSYRKWADANLDAKWARLIAVREAVLKKLEERRSSGEIGSSLEAEVELAAAEDSLKKLLTDNKNSLRYLFIVSSVKLADVPVYASDVEAAIPLAIYVRKAPGGKCQRCWNYSSHVGRDKIHPTLCERCVETVSQ